MKAMQFKYRWNEALINEAILQSLIIKCLLDVLTLAQGVTLMFILQLSDLSQSWPWLM